MKNPIIIATIVIVFALLFWAPWMGDGDVASRNLLSQESVKAEIDNLSTQYSCSDRSDNDCCDGLSNHWAPFGRTIEYCAYGSWYVPFWRQ